MRGLPVGAVRLGISRTPVDRVLWEQTLKVLGVLFLLMLVGIGSIWRFSRRMVQPIQRLRDSAQAVQAGDLTRRVAVDRPDEIGELAAAFNAMTAELARSHTELERKEEMRARLLEQVITAQEDERKRIARELHDETSQALTSLMVGLKVLEQRPDLADGKEALADLRALTAKTLDAVHDLSLQLRPSVLDDLGLVPAMERLVTEFGRTHGISRRASRPTSAPVPDFHPRWRRRCTESPRKRSRTWPATPALGPPVLSSSGARASSRSSSRTTGGVSTSPVNSRRAAMAVRSGIFGMRERATLLGGTLTIESTPGAGTTVFVEIPLQMERTDDRTPTHPHSPGR